MSKKRFIIQALLIVALLAVLGISMVSAQSISGPHLLAWQGNGAAAGQHSASDPGKLVYVGLDGTIQNIMDVPQGATRVIACGDGASPDNQHFAFYMGQDTGTLYMLSGGDNLVTVDDTFHGLGCTGARSLQYSPDSNRFATIDYPETPSDETYPAVGRLRLGSTDSGAYDESFDNAATFWLSNDQLVYISLFNNDKGEATEAGVELYDGNAEREISTLYADDGCRFTSAQIALAGDKIVAVMGHRCKAGGVKNQYRFYVVDPSNRSATLALSDDLAGGYFWYARANNIFAAPSGQTVLFTVPDGLAASSVGVMSVNMSDTSSTQVIPSMAQMPRFTNRPYSADNHWPVMSPDGRWLALVTNTANDQATLYVFDLTNPSSPPLEHPQRNRGDVVTDIMFTPDSSHMIYVAGVPNGGDNSILSLELSSDNEFRVARGHFDQGVISPDGNTIALGNWQTPDDPKQPQYLNLETVDINSSATTTLFEGADIVDGKVQNQRFLYPLAWLPG